MRTLDLRGMRFGRWIALRRAQNSAKRSGRTARWVCRCDCGRLGIVRSFHLRARRSLSCGCLRKELAKGAKAKYVVTVGAKTLTLSGWERETGISRHLAGQRIRAGWLPHRAVTVPSRKRAGRKLAQAEVAA